MKGGEGTTRTPGWQPKETASQLPRKAILSNQRGCCTQGEGTQGPWRRGATGCCRLSRQLLARYGWTVACVGQFVSFVALLDKPVEDTSVVLVYPAFFNGIKEL